MADVEKHQYPFVRANGHTRNDDESGSSLQHSAEELKRKKRVKLAIYIAIFLVFQIIVITALGLTVMKVKSPKLRISNIQLQTLKTNSSTSSPMFEMSLATKVSVKNPNFGRYKFESTNVTFTYKGVAVGQMLIEKGKAGVKSTKKVSAVVVTLKSGLLPNAGELGGGTLTLSSAAEMRGKVKLLFIINKNKSALMNCTITIDVVASAVKTLLCK